MNCLAQLLMWVALAIGSLAYLGFLLFRLAKKGMDVLEVAKPLLTQVGNLSEALSAKSSYEKPDDNLLDDLNTHRIERANLMKRRARKAEQRQRRLIENLKDFDSQESGLNNGRT